MVASEAATLARIEPIRTWNTPIATTGWILLVDGVVWKIRGNSWLSHSRAEFLFLSCVSVPLWLVFEFYNKYVIHAWHYMGLADRSLRYLWYAWCFATICPALFETGDLISALRDRRAPSGRTVPPARHAPGVAGWVIIAAGAAMLLMPIAFPSPYMAAPLFLGFTLLLDPLDARGGAESILADLRDHRHGRLINLAAAGLIWGILSEFWNYRAAMKWFYLIPIAAEWRAFEMPLPGYLGYPAFALEGFAMYVTARRLVWRAASRPISI